jgi:hypothetical protein
MKKITSMLFVFLLVAIFSCSKNGNTTPPEEVATKFPAPVWKEDNTGKYPATMTSVVALPVTLAGSILQNDQLAAFVNGECRGVGVIEKVNNRDLFFVLIQGLPDETSKVKFRYYSSKSSYMYESNDAINFLIDAIYGTAQNPKTLELSQLK